MFRAVGTHHLQETCQSRQVSLCDLPLILPFLFGPSVLGKALPHTYPPLSQIDKSLGPKCMKDTRKSSSGELLIEIVLAFYVPFRSKIDDFILLVGIFCVMVVTEF